MSDKPEDYELFHYGVKGMKWGVRREDRPSASERKAARTENRQVKREAKATKFDAKAYKLRSRIDSLKDVPVSDIKLSKSNAKLIKKLEKKEIRTIKDAANVRDGKMTRNQRNVAIGAAVLATYATYKVARYNIESGEVNRLSQKGKAFMEGRDATDLKRGKRGDFFASDLDADKLHVFVASGVNPGYGGIGTKMNCRRCTFTYELRRRGYDVTASKTTKGTGQNLVGLENALTPGRKQRGTSLPSIITSLAKDNINKARNPDAETPFSDILNNAPSQFGKNKIRKMDDEEDFSGAIFETLANQPSGSRGEIGVKWKAGGGHSMAYEIVNGNPVIFDTQTGDAYKKPTDFLDLGKNVTDAGFTRLDNVDLNTDYLLKWVKNG